MEKPGATKPKPSGKKKTPEKEGKSQAERFVETARLLEADETGKKFLEAFSRINPPR